MRIGEEEGDAPDHTHKLAAMIDQCLPYPGQLERDWILWVELWLRAVRHPELRPTAGDLYERMRAWFADAIAAGAKAGEFDSAADPDRIADRILALCDGFGVRSLLGDLEIERARAEVWAVVSRDLGVDPYAPRALIGCCAGRAARRAGPPGRRPGRARHRHDVQRLVRRRAGRLPRDRARHPRRGRGHRGRPGARGAAAPDRALRGAGVRRRDAARDLALPAVRRERRRRAHRVRGHRPGSRGRDRERAPDRHALRARVDPRRALARGRAQARARDAPTRDQALPATSGDARAARRPGVPHRRHELALAPRLADARVARLEGDGRRGSARLLPRGLAGPGRATRSDLDRGDAAAADQAPRDARPDRLGHGGRAVDDARQQARRRGRRARRGRRPRPVGVGPPRCRLDLRRRPRRPRHAW